MEESTDEALARAVDAVYAVAPADFVTTRKEWVARLRKEGLREVAAQVGALRKPSVAAAAVNATVRADDPVVARLLDVGGRMRHAQSTLDAAALGALRVERDELLAAWVAAARQNAGGLTAAVEAEVRDTAVAALADAAAAEVVLSGSLVRAVSYSGFGEVDVADAVARTSTGVVLTRIEGGREGDGPAEDEEGAEVDEVAAPAEAGAEEGTEEATEEEAGEGTEEEAGEGTEKGARDDAVAGLEMALDEAEKVVAAARAARRRAADEDAAAEAELSAATERVEQAEQVLAEARQEADRAVEARDGAAAALAAAAAELDRSREERDAARAALEEAEDG